MHRCRASVPERRLSVPCSPNRFRVGTNRQSGMESAAADPSLLPPPNTTTQTMTVSSGMTPDETRASVFSVAMLTDQRSARGCAVAVSLGLVIALAGCGGVSATTKAADCLSKHGWQVEQHSSGVVVAVDEPYRLVYQPSRKAGPAVQTGWTGFGPTVKTTLGEGGFFMLPVCFGPYARSIHSFASSTP